jgi:hypothetical protein
MADRLFDQQASLLAYLTSSAAIFGDRDAPAGAGIAGIDRALLRLGARFSHQKRMEKIAAVFPRTFTLLGPGFDRIVREFVESCPPTEIGRLVNARQFHFFLRRRWRHARSEPKYLLDVAACELACAEVRNADAFGTRPAKNNGADRSVATSGPAIRRHPAIRLLRSAYDVRPLFEAARVDEAPEAPLERDTTLAIVLSPNADQLQVFELLPSIFEMLAALEDWTSLAELGMPSAFDDTVLDLAARGLIEVNP